VEARTLAIVRRAVLALVALGTVAMCVELALIGHYEDQPQLIPLALGGAGLAVLAWIAIRPGKAALRLFQFLMLLFIGAGVTGIVLHFEANAEFQREIDPAITGTALVWKVLEATAPPALAPGLMVQLGVLGLVYTYRHPVFGDQDFESAN
jgi:FtsH-binding integral membrane protein